MLAPEERAGRQRGKAADRCAGECDDRKLAAEVTAEMVDGEKPEGQDAAFEGRREDGADGAGDDADNDVRSAHKHLDSFVER